MGERKGKRGDRCDTCGRPRGIEQWRKSFGIHSTLSIPRTGDPNDTPRQIHNDLICNVSVYRNGGTFDDSHLCNECLRVALRAIKVEVSALLGELDTGHDMDAEVTRLTERLALLQARHSNVCFDHNRMQERMRDLLPHVRRDAERELVRVAEWEATRGPALSADESEEERADG